MEGNSLSQHRPGRRARRRAQARHRRLRVLIAPLLAVALVIAAPVMAVADETGTDQSAQQPDPAPTTSESGDAPAGETPDAQDPAAQTSTTSDTGTTGDEPDSTSAAPAPQAREAAAPETSPSPSPSPSPTGSAKVTLVKKVINDDGGTATPADWSLQVSQDSESWQTLPQGVATELALGTWYLRETGGPAGYELTDLSCDNYTFDKTAMTITLRDRDDNTCTFTNNDDVPSFDLGITKTHGDLPAHGGVEAGSTFDWFIAVTNYGPGESTAAVVTDDIPAGLTVLGVEASTGDASFVANHVEVALPALTSGETVTITVHVQVNPDPAPAQAAFAPPGTPAPTMGELPGDFVNTACVKAEGETTAAEQHENCADDTVPRKAVLANVWVSCINDAPFLMFEVTTTSNLDGLPITFTWSPLTGSGVEPAQVSMVVTPNVVTRVDWPGVSWNSDGVSYDWPGWRPLRPSDFGTDGLPLPGLIVYGNSVRDESEPDEAWRQQTQVSFSVNPVFSSMAVYPPSTPQCAVPASAVVLAETGGADDSGPLMTLAALALFGGAVLLRWDRRRRAARTVL